MNVFKNKKNDGKIKNVKKRALNKKRKKRFFTSMVALAALVFFKCYDSSQYIADAAI